MEYKFGICYCNLDITNKVENLIIVDTYEEAFQLYMDSLDKKI